MESENQASGLYGYAPAAAEQGAHATEMAPTALAVPGVQHAHLDERVATTDQEKAALDAARISLENEVQHAIANGVPLSKLPPNAAGLNVEATYRDVAARNGTSPEQIQKKHDEEAQKAMETVQHAMGGLVGLAVLGAAPAEVAPLAMTANSDAPKYVLNDDERHLVSTTQVIAEMGMQGGFRPDNTPAQAPSRNISQGRG